MPSIKGNKALINLLNTILTNLKLDIKRYDKTKIHTNIIILFISLFLCQHCRL